MAEIDYIIGKLESASRHFKLTTVGYSKMKQPLPPTSQWAMGFKDYNEALDLLKESQAPVPEPPPVTESQLGFYCWGQNPSAVKSAYQWLGQTPKLAEEFLAGDNWAAIEGPGWTLDPWKNQGMKIVLGAPMFPPGNSLQQGAAGVYDDHWTKLAQNIKSRNLDVIMRPAWEVGGGWYIWTPKNAQESGYFAQYFRRIVDKMRAVIPGLPFCWNPVWGWQSLDPILTYPGDQYVDSIGIDIYDQSWASNFQNPQARWNDFLNSQWGGNFWTAFAKQHGVPLSVPEWGLATRSDGHGGGDCPEFIDFMADWINQNDIAWHVYFNVDAPDGKHEIHDSNQFPNSKARFKARFG